MVIIESIVSTVDQEKKVNLAPMGVLWGEEVLVIKPYKDTTTYRNLIATKEGVVNVTDNVLIFAKSALSDVQFPHFPASHVEGVVLEDACYYYEVVASKIDVAEERAEISCEVVGRGWLRDFLGFNRGKNAVIEAAILATRLRFYERQEVLAKFQCYEEIVAKTGGKQEMEAMRYLMDYLKGWPFDDKN